MPEIIIVLDSGEELYFDIIEVNNKTGMVTGKMIKSGETQQFGPDDYHYLSTEGR